MVQYTYEQDTAALLFDPEISSNGAVTGDDVKDSLLFAEIGVSVFFGNFFTDLSFQRSNEGEDDYQQDVFESGQFENGDPFILQYTESARSKFEREEFSLSVGYALTDRTGFFVGYRQHETKFDDRGMRVGTQAELTGVFSVDSIIRRDSEFEQDGFFLGATYVWPYESEGWLNGALAVDLGVAFLDGKRRNTEQEDFIDFDSQRTEKFSTSGEGIGFNLGIAWSGPLPLGERLNYSIGVDGYQYNYDGDDGTANFEDTLFRVTSYEPASPQAESDAATLTSLSLFDEPENEQQLEQLYERGTAQLAAKKLTIPRGDNALQTFNTMLTIDADDERALSGIAAIVDRYAGLAKQRSHKDLEGAIDLLDRGLQIDAQSNSLLDLRQQLVQELADPPAKLEVKRLLTHAEQQIKARKYMRPPGDNAYETLRAAQAQAPKDQRITRAFDNLLQQVSAQARKQQELENWQAALAYVEDALRIAPKDAALVARKEQINQSLQQAAKPADEAIEEVDTAAQEEPKKRKRRIIGNF